jgi:hypothetical protein
MEQFDLRATPLGLTDTRESRSEKTQLAIKLCALTPALRPDFNAEPRDPQNCRAQSRNM